MYTLQCYGCIAIVSYTVHGYVWNYTHITHIPRHVPIGTIQTRLHRSTMNNKTLFQTIYLQEQYNWWYNWKNIQILFCTLGDISILVCLYSFLLWNKVQYYSILLDLCYLLLSYIIRTQVYTYTYNTWFLSTIRYFLVNTKG